MKTSKAAVLTPNAMTILEKRYLDGGTVDQMWDRVSGGNETYRELMSSLRCSPNSPSLFNLGKNNGCTSSACFTLDIRDSMFGKGSIVDTRNKAIAIAKAGGGVGYYFGLLRPKGAPIKSIHRKACGPVAVLKDYHAISSLITQGGKRELAQMGVLNCDHPDIEEFIRCKSDDPQGLGSFNISVSWADEKINQAFNGQPGNPSRLLWDKQCQAAWGHGCPGMLFYDTINRVNQNPHIGPFRCTNPCGEVPNRGTGEPCLTGDSLIDTPEGLVPISELLKREEFSVNTYDQVTVSGCRAISRGQKSVLQVMLMNGQIIRCTPNHKILTNGGWCRAEDLTEGSMVRIADKQTTNPVLCESLLDEMFGWQLGDGWYSKENSMGILFSEDDQEAMDKLMPVWDEFVEKDYALQIQPTGVKQKSCNKKSTIDKFSALGFKVARATEKSLPDYIFKALPHQQIAFMRGLFSADGCVKMAGCGLRNLITLSSSSKLLLRQVQTVLLRYGIQGRIQWTEFITSKRNGQGQFQISGESALRYMDVIGFNLTAKTEAFDRGMRPQGNKEYFPVKKVWKLGGHYEVFDILMPERHHFLANGVVVHNCNLMSLSLPRYFLPENRSIDWRLLEEDIWNATYFMDDILDRNEFPHPDITEAAILTRRLGLGVMGWADLLAMMHIHYDTQDALDLADKIMSLMEEVSHSASEQMAKEKGPYKGYDSVKTNGPCRRNETTTSQAPTGTISIICGVWGGIEPHFSLRCERTTAEGIKMQDGVQDWCWELFDGFVPKTAHEITPEWHIRHQAVFQSHIDLGASKTINLPHSASVNDVSKAYKLMYDLKTKGGTIFRDGCRDEQVLVKKKTSSVYQTNLPADLPKSLPDTVNHALLDTMSRMPDAAPKPARKIKIVADEIDSKRVKIHINDFKAYLHVGLDEDTKQPVEIFIRASKNGSTINGFLDAWAISFSMLLQAGVSLAYICDKHKGQRFEPAGLTGNKDVSICSSVVDFVAQWLYKRYVVRDALLTGKSIPGGSEPSVSMKDNGESKPIRSGQLCPDCGNEMVHQAGCLLCVGEGCGFSRCN